MSTLVGLTCGPVGRLCVLKQMRACTVFLYLWAHTTSIESADPPLLLPNYNNKTCTAARSIKL